MPLSKDEIEEDFKRSNDRKRQIGTVPRAIQQYLQFMEHKIRKQFKSFSIVSLCGGNRSSFMVDQHFERAFQALNLGQKAEYYSKYISCIDKAIKKFNGNLGRQAQKSTVNQDQDNITIPLKVGKGNNSFSESEIQIRDLKVRSKGKTAFDIDLRNYLLRKSKKKDPVYVLQAIKASSPETIRFCFLSLEDQGEYLPVVTKAVDDACYQNIQRQIGKAATSSKNIKLKNSKGEEPRSSLHLDSNSLLNSRRNNKLNRSIVEDVVKSREEQELDEQLTDVVQQQNQQVEKMFLGNNKSNSINMQLNRNVFRIILPTFSLKNMPSLHHYASIYESSHCNLYAYQNVKRYSEFKMQMRINLPVRTVCKALTNVQLYKHWHPEIRQGQIKMRIAKQNSCILYMKSKALSEWYKERDYLLLAHMFHMKDTYYIVSKSIENSMFVPFSSIVRGTFYHLVWKIQSQSSRDSQKCTVTMDMKVDHNGLLNKTNHKELTTRFMKGFEKLEKFYSIPDNLKKLKQILSFEWVLEQDDASFGDGDDRLNNSVRTNDFDAASQMSQNLNETSQTFYSIEDLSEDESQENKLRKQESKSDHQIEPEKLQLAKSQILFRPDEEENIKLDSEGLVILPTEYLKKKHILYPFDCPKNPMKLPYESILCKDDWVIDDKVGGLKLVNQVKIDAQNNVIKFIMKTLKKNLFSGKGLLNISLPVEIFNTDSNLQRLCQGMSLGPQFLEPAAKMKNKLDRFKKILAFGLSNTTIYVDVEKPFNPILGQTYQGHIRGCPIFAEQISHHPPITSILFQGRGYRVTGNFEGKVRVKMNSGEGSNDGYYTIRFDDGHQVLFSTPAGQLSGLAMGDRRFNVRGSGLYFDEENGYFCELSMENKGGMFSKKRQFGDQIDGQILKVKHDYIRKLKQITDFTKIPQLSQSDIIEKLGVVSGRWPLQLKIDGVTYYDVIKDVPDKMVHEIYPLPSNSNYREDLLYRKKNDLSRSQIQKQRLEVIQRGDRKLREKLGGKKGH